MLAGLLLGTIVHFPPPPRAGAVHSAVAAPSIVVGTQRLYRCTIVVTGYCGRLKVPLNWLDASEGTISIRYQWLPARVASPNRSQTIVAEEGGPGYATTGTGYEYLNLFEPLMHDHNLLMMDQRGTGGSEAIYCAALQPFGGTGPDPVPFGKAVALCGAQLNHTYRDNQGRYVHASDLFGTSQSVRDLAAILAALKQRRVDFYGDSYGSFFGQVFASRYPQLVRVLVLDSTYPTVHQDPFDRAGQAEIRYGFTVVCRRSLACSAQTAGSPLARIASLDASLDAHPAVGRTRLPNGRALLLRMSGPDIWTLLSSAGDDYGPYRNLDAAARAYLERGDAVPLLRLDAWTSYGPAFTGYGYREYSEGLAIADSCTVYKNPFSMEAPIPQRQEQYLQAVAAIGPAFGYPLIDRDVFASPAEWYNNCLEWPAPVQHDPIVTQPVPIVPATLPVLVISGDLDETTSPGDNREAAHDLGPSVVEVLLPNEIHASALLDPYDCPSAIVRAFMLAPGSADASCGARIPEVRTVGTFPLVLADEPPATPAPGNVATTTELRLAAIAVAAIGDAIQGANYNYEGYDPNCGTGYCGPGLRGGSFRASPELRRIDLERVAYSNDTTVSGTVSIASAVWPGDAGVVTARNVTASTRDGRTAISLDVTYDERVVHAIATLSGRTARGVPLRATMPAP